VPPQLTRVSLAALQQPVEQELDVAFHELGRIVSAELPGIRAVNQHLLRIRGKMFRPTLLLLAAQATDNVTPRATTLGACIELIHLATLIHDDSVDHSVLRRGQPTVNALFSHQVAVIMGDYLYSRAIVELVALGDPEVLQVVAGVTNEMTVGEMHEIEAHDVLTFSEGEYDRLIEAKTASLIAGACEVGAIGADQAYREPLQRYGRNLGMAFQIVDDLLDYVGSEEVTGKPAGLDLREHKITLPLIAALPSMDPDERTAARDLMASPKPSDAQIADVIRIVEARGGVAAARVRASEFAEAAEAKLDSVPGGRARDALRDALRYVLDRQS
jgi:octaprenyl-diphosphate synthase